MDFVHRKLPQSAALNLRMCPISTVVPYALLFSPVYIYLRRNLKYVSIKAPLDFFEPHELERWKVLDVFYLPKFVDRTAPFRAAARAVYGLMQWEPRIVRDLRASDARGYPKVALPASPYELSDAIIRTIGPLWGFGKIIEPFFISVFANELCEILPAEDLKLVRNLDYSLYELAIFRASYAVFLGLHLGYSELGFLNRLRHRVFLKTIRSTKETGEGGAHPETRELIGLVEELISDPNQKVIEGGLFDDRPGTVAKKISDRLKRVASQFIRQNQPVATIHGPGGIFDV